ncbi:GATA type transcriptional activator of nitrogen-regulated proteins [Diatrype stigma]|uniref:GATA type transcriptional activator of nitrogen-regulated proteins n=1 Tax=Diatrype stigma TaxID=117547 RepID=A0AAN9UU61_9PEZI
MPSNESSQDSAKRMSSIKSILNPAAESSSNFSAIDHMSEAPHYRRSPASTASANSPGRYPGATNTLPSMFGRESPSESEQSKAEKRLALQQEAARMRQMLAAKERELAALGEENF